MGTYQTINTDLANGELKEYCKITENSLKFNVAKGQLNKFEIRPRIGNEHVESSDTIIGTITTNNIVGQIFKASKDNIDGLGITLQSDAGAQLDNFESYANSTELQTDNPTGYTGWVEDTNPATLETTIVKSGSKSMKLPLDTATDKWVNTIPAQDFTGYTGSFDFYQTTIFGITGAVLSVFIGDGTNTKSLELAFSNINDWNHFEINEAAMSVTANDATASPPDITQITQIGFRVDVKKIGAFAYIDNLVATPAPGRIEVKLWDMGKSKPISGETSIDSGTQYTTINKTASSVFVDLIGGKRIYHLHSDFNLGVYKNDSDNVPIIENHYYLIELKYVDTPVNVYGPDPTKLVKYYSNGYAFTAPDEATAITSAGDYHDIMFYIQSMQDIYVLEASWRFDNPPNGSSDIFVFLENYNNTISHVITDHEEHPAQNEEEDVSIRPMYLASGGKIEFYYNDDFTDSVSSVVCSVTYLYKDESNNC